MLLKFTKLSCFQLWESIIQKLQYASVVFLFFFFSHPGFTSLSAFKTPLTFSWENCPFLGYTEVSDPSP